MADNTSFLSKDKLRNLQTYAMRPEVVFAVGVMLAASMLIMPLPTFVVDMVVAFNFAIAFFMLLIAFGASDPLGFSTYPTVILMATVLRLSLNIATSRLVLATGDAGAMIEAFGNFVVAGNIVVGLVAFMILAVVQFLVVTKGAERVAEVAARFTLDAMPGKQMAIDAELRSGDIDAETARARRRRLDSESQFFGAMDGAMKFVKGDSIATMVIIFINLIGGILIGIAQRGLSFDEAMQTYAVLSVGDALVAQIPSFLSAVAAGILVTRTGEESSSQLGNVIGKQLFSDLRITSIVAIMLFLLAFVPGFPKGIFFILSLAFGSISLAAVYRNYKIRQAEKEQTLESEGEGASEVEKIRKPKISDQVVLVVSKDHESDQFEDELMQAMRKACNIYLDWYNIDVKPMPLDYRSEIPEGGWQIEYYDIPAAQRREAFTSQHDLVENITLDINKYMATNIVHFMDDAQTVEWFNIQEEAIKTKIDAIDTRLKLDQLKEILKGVLNRGYPLRPRRLIIDTIDMASKTNNKIASIVDEIVSVLDKNVCYYGSENNILNYYTLGPAVIAKLNSDSMTQNDLDALDIEFTGEGRPSYVLVNNMDVQKVSNALRKRHHVVVVDENSVPEDLSLRHIQALG